MQEYGFIKGQVEENRREAKGEFCFIER